MTLRPTFRGLHQPPAPLTITEPIGGVLQAWNYLIGTTFVPRALKGICDRVGSAAGYQARLRYSIYYAG